MTETDRRRAMLWGAFVADAASLGFHWLYDQDRIRAIAPKSPEFRAPTAADFDGVAGYFAHGTKSVGDLTHYGEQALVLLRTVASRNGYSRAAYSERFQAHFGYGGTHVGYIDHATRDSLDNLARMTAERFARAQAVDISADKQVFQTMLIRCSIQRG